MSTSPHTTFAALAGILLLMLITGCSGNFGRYNSLNDITPKQHGEASCQSNEECVATFHCDAVVTCAHTDEQPMYTDDYCREPNISQNVLDECKCRNDTCGWP